MGVQSAGSDAPEGLRGLRFGWWGVLLGLVVLHWSLARSAQARWSVTTDETGHLAAAIAIADRGDYRCVPEHPPLAFRVAGTLGANLPIPTASGAWQQGQGWSVGGHMLELAFQRGERPHDHVQAMRIGPSLWGVALVVLVAWWGWRRHGVWGGAIAATLAACSPLVLAHASLLTTDVPAAVTCTLALLAADAMLRDPAPKRVALAALALGVALATKYSALLLGPALIALAAWRCYRGTGAPWRRSVAALALAAVGVLPVVWICYGLQGGVGPDRSFAFDWAGQAASGPVGGVLHAVAGWLLPEAWCFGAAKMLAKHGERITYLFGTRRVGGSVFYFPVAFLVKTALPMLLLLGASAVAAWRARAGATKPGRDAMVIWVTVYGAVAVVSGLNIGARHLLPIYPALFVAAAGALVLVREAWHRWVLGGIVALQVVGALWAWPHYIAHFNWLVGGSGNGRAVLLDSNLDWGQDLPALRDWMEREGVDTVDLHFFGTADPLWYGVESRALLVHDPDGRQRLANGPVRVLSAQAWGLALKFGNDEIPKLLAPLRQREPDAIAGASLLIYDDRERRR